MTQRKWMVMLASLAAWGCPGSSGSVGPTGPKTGSKDGLAVSPPTGCQKDGAGVREIADWSAESRAELARRAREGAVVIVRADSCGIELLPACLAPGRYVYGASPGDDGAAGSFDLSSGVPASDDLLGECENATHAVVKVFVGADEGDRSACVASADAPPAGCDRPLKIELASFGSQSSQPEPPPPPPPDDPDPLSCGPDDPLCNP